MNKVFIQVVLLSFLAISVQASETRHVWLLSESNGEIAADWGTAGTNMKIIHPAWSEKGPFENAGALSFDGSGKTYGVLDCDFSTSKGTVEMWICPSRLTGGQLLFSSMKTSTSRLSLSLDEGDLVGVDQWWQQSNSIRAKRAFTADDLGKWSYVALTWNDKGYALYKNGKELCCLEAKTFPDQSGRMAIGINSWDLKSQPFSGLISQVRLSTVDLPAGKGTGSNELAWAANLKNQVKPQPILKWGVIPGNEKNIFIRETPRVLKLSVINRYIDIALAAPLQVTITLTDRYTGKELSPLVVTLDKDIPPQTERNVDVNLPIREAGVYDVVARVNEDSQASTQATWIRGAPPEDDTGVIPFFGNSSHTGFTREDFLLRRECGSRAERGSLVMWNQKEAGTFDWPAQENDPAKIAVDNGCYAFGYTGYTPEFASSMPEEKRDIHDVPELKWYVAWIEAAAKQYQGIVKYWEIWNEPNMDGTYFKGSAEQLSDLHKAGALALRRAGTDLKNIGASTACIDPEFMDRMNDAGAVDYMDVIAFHNYRWDYPPDAGIVRDLNRMKEWRDNHAPNRPLWDDEWGAWANQQTQTARYANLTARQLIITKAQGIQHSDCYTWDGHPFYRLLWQGWPTPAWIAYRTVAQQLTNALPKAVLYEGEDGKYVYLFVRENKVILAGWTDRESQTTKVSIPVEGKVSVCDLMGNPIPVQVQDDNVEITLTNGPVFLEGCSQTWAKGLKQLSQPRNGTPPERNNDVWFSFHYPEGTEVVSLPCGQTREVALRVYNDGETPHTCQFNAISESQELHVSPKRTTVEVAPRSMKEFKLNIRSKAPVKSEGVQKIRILGTTDGRSCGQMKIRCYVAEHETIFYRMATWEMTHYMVDMKDSGQSIHLRWVNPGGYLLMKYDLPNASDIKFNALVNSLSPTPSDGGNYRIRVSTDQKQWKILLDASSDWAWKTLDLSEYAGQSVYVKFDNASDKGAARIKAVRLDFDKK